MFLPTTFATMISICPLKPLTTATTFSGIVVAIESVNTPNRTSEMPATITKGKKAGNQKRDMIRDTVDGRMMCRWRAGERSDIANNCFAVGYFGPTRAL